MANNYDQATISPFLPASLFSARELQSLEIACGLSWETYGDDLYFFAADFFGDEGEDEEGRNINIVELLQAKLRQLDPAAYPHITIHGASTCSKMRENEFGGFAYVITRDDVRSLWTWSWLAEQTSQRVAAPDTFDAPDDRTIRIEVRGGGVQDVSNIPPGWTYQIVDHDDLSETGETEEA